MNTLNPATRYVLSILIVAAVFLVLMVAAVVLKDTIPHVEKIIYALPLLFVGLSFALQAKFLRGVCAGKK